MVLLASTFLDSSLAVLPPPPPPLPPAHPQPPSFLPQQHRHFPLRSLAQLPPSSSSSPHGLSKQQQQQQHGFDQPPEASLQTKAHSWIPFFFFGSGKKAGKPLVGQESAPQSSSSSSESGSSSSSASASAQLQDQGPYSIISPPDAPIMASSPPPVKKSTTRGGHKKVVVFTPQKAQELRKKLKGTDSFHDFMYHSAIASRLASHDNDH